MDGESSRGCAPSWSPVRACTGSPGSASRWSWHRVDTAWLDVLVGGSVLLAATLLLRRHRAGIDGPVKGVSVGLGAGFMNTTCGIAAPALTRTQNNTTAMTKTIGRQRTPLEP